MKERPILFSGEMVRAILAGNKTQTRRVIKLNGSEEVIDGMLWRPDMYGDWHPIMDYCPYHNHMRLWVRETWAACHPGRDTTFESINPRPNICSMAYKATEQRGIVGRWRSPIHMPRWASRITLEVTGVRVERVQDIREEDAIAEGLATWQREEGAPIHYGINRADVWEQDPRLTYKRLWDSINGKKYPWSSAPWVWVVEFKQVTP